MIWNRHKHDWAKWETFAQEKHVLEELEFTWMVYRQRRTCTTCGKVKMRKERS